MAEKIEEYNGRSKKRNRAEESDDMIVDDIDRLSSAAVASILIASKISQLTIFYDGEVCVYDDVPPEKAQAIMKIAAAASASVPVTRSTSPSTAASSSNPEVSDGATVPVVAAAGAAPVFRSPSLTEASGAPSLCKLQAEIPLARRQSLQRFLEKRRDRLTFKALQSPRKAMNSTDSEASTRAPIYH